MEPLSSYKPLRVRFSSCESTVNLNLLTSLLLVVFLLILFETSCCCNNQADINLSGYRKHLQSKSAPKPLTFAEEELAEIKRQEVQLFCIFVHNIFGGI